MMNETTKIMLERYKIGLLQTVSQELLDARVDISQVPMFEYGQIAVKIQGYIWGRKVARWEMETPRDWWQHFKHRWFPTWAKDRWPVENTGTTIELRALYPSLKEETPAQELVLHVLKDDETVARYWENGSE